ncbi:MAG: helicase-associated domain-containing protein [Anaerolineae bacterium]|nr:helicase-associated domain-containing protein [Anaerolineae bacterium]
MELSEILYSYTNDHLQRLAGLCNCRGHTRKDDLVRCIHRAVMVPELLRQLWQQMDDLSKKAIAAAYHNDGEFNQRAFVAQYGSLPERPQSGWGWRSNPILLDLFLHNGHLPSDLVPLLANLVPPPDKFQLTGVSETPTTLAEEGYSLDLMCTETEQAGLHDLLAYLRLADQGQLKIGGSSGRATKGSIQKIMAGLLAGDFWPPPADFRADQTIRPFGLDVFAQGAGLVAKARGRNQLQLTAPGREFYQTQNPALLLEAFETWVADGSFDELSRISALKGQRSRRTRLTPPSVRREAVIEALSWCPVGVWIDLQDFYRALKIWHFDFEVETTQTSNLYVGHPEYGMLYGNDYWLIVKGLYVNVVLWEYLGSMGALDLLFTDPADANPKFEHFYADEALSLYDGLRYFRINNLGAYLLGQAEAYTPQKPPHEPLFVVSADLHITLIQGHDLTPNEQNMLAQLATPVQKHRCQLDTRQLLNALEEGADFDRLAGFLHQRHNGPLPPAVTTWLEQVRQNSQAFRKGEPAVFVNADTPDLVEMVLADPVLQKFCYAMNQSTLIIPVRREKAFRARLKELGYILQP